MGARLVVKIEVTGQDSTQVSFAEDKNVIETLAPDRAKQAPGERILPGAVWRGENLIWKDRPSACSSTGRAPFGEWFLRALTSVPMRRLRRRIKLIYAGCLGQSRMTVVLVKNLIGPTFPIL